MTRYLGLLLFLFLAGCSGPHLPFAKEQPADGKVLPPWEAMVAAGPGAENDIDLETLNGSLVRPLQATETAPPAQADVAVAAEPVEPPPPKKPTSDAVVIRAVAVLPVKGKGGAELTAAMILILENAGWPVRRGSSDDAIDISGSVAIGAVKDGQQVVQLAWIIKTPKGKVLGEIKQQNAVPAGSLDGGWGENARFACDGAAEGIFKLIQQYR